MQRSQDMEENPLVEGILTSEEISAATAILHYYDRQMWHTTMPSRKRSQRSIEVTAVVVKLSLALSGRDVALTEQDIGYLQAAFRLFISEVKTKTPPSESRDSLLVSCSALAEVFTTLIPATPTGTEQGGKGK